MGLLICFPVAQYIEGIDAFRVRGHQNANLDPLGLWQRDKVRDLQLSHHDLSENDFDKEYNVGSFAIGQETMKLGELYKTLRKTYCGSVGAEYMHITSTDEKRWLEFERAHQKFNWLTTSKKIS